LDCPTIKSEELNMLRLTIQLRLIHSGQIGIMHLTGISIDERFSREDPVPFIPAKEFLFSHTAILPFNTPDKLWKIIQGGSFLSRVVKTPKLYFMDTGLAAYLTKWQAPILTHRGMTEWLKKSIMTFIKIKKGV
jgi:hypothetical protein